MSLKVFVIIGSILIILGFIGSCYLMTTVNPKPIDIAEKLDSEHEFAIDFENMPDQDNLRDVQYGLEKAPPSSETPLPLPYLFRKNNPKLLSSQKYSNLKTVYPPNQLSLYSNLHVTRTSPMMASLPNTTLSHTCHVSIHSQVTELPKNNTANTTEHAKVVKGRRRSINSLQKRFDEITGSIVLKIVDEHGNSRVEIKVNSEDTQTFRNKNISVDNNSVLDTNDTSHDFLISIDELPDKTEIRILPNATLVVSDVSEEFVSELDTSTEDSSLKPQITQQNVTQKHTSKYDVKGQNDTIAVISRPESNGPTAAMTVALSKTDHVIQQTTQSVKQLLKTISTGDLALKVLFDNVTRSFNIEE